MLFKIIYVSKGKLRKKIVRAKTAKEAIDNLKKREKRVIIRKVEEIKKTTLIEKFLKKFEFSKINLEEYISILDQLYVMLNAGLGIDVILEEIRENIKNKRLKYIFDTLANDIKAGFSLSNSIKKFEKDLGTLSVAMIMLGEETGDLATTIKDLSEILREILENKKRLKKATRYPTFVVFAMIIAFAIVLVFVIPPFKSIFEELGSKLPLPTRLLLGVEYVIEHYSVYIIIIVFFLILGTIHLYRSREEFRLKADELMLKIYIIGPIIRLAMVGRFIFVFQRLIEAGIPIFNAVEIALNIVENKYIYNKLLAIKNSIVHGGSIKSGFEESEMFEKMIIQIIAAGEESGALSEMLKKASDYYLNKYRNIVDNISTLIEPFLTAVIAVFVLILALGIFLPMWNLAQAV